jgi:hypothetical protein
MNDNLRSAGLIPTTEPYTALGFAQVNGGTETTTAGVLSNTGNNAIVDWVMIELRSAANPAILASTRCALLQRDGDVVAAGDGTSPASLRAAPGSYYVVLRHRNHFGVMTAAAITLAASPAASVDFTLAGTATFGTNATKNLTDLMGLWAGNVQRDTELKYTGSSNDRDPILVRVGSTTPNNVANGYFQEDVAVTIQRPCRRGSGIIQGPAFPFIRPRRDGRVIFRASMKRTF